ncbi:MAG: hypothetical protein AB1705_15245 [Verrucomicrobiota bacterium]
MRRLYKILGCLAVTVGLVHQTGAFSLLGPSPAVGPTPALNPAVAWQNPAFNIGYGQFNTDIGGPMNLGEEYRWNLPVITYAFDQTFLNYFGARGVQEVEQAIAMLSGTNYFRSGTNVLFNTTALTNGFSGISSNLAEFPLDTQRINFRAQAVGLLDLRSTALALLLEEMGLADAERFAWTLRARFTFPGSTNYLVIQRNFDPVTLQPTAFVNNKLLTYRIFEFDQVAPFPDFADAIEFNVDGTEITPTTVASFGLNAGGYYTALSRDDVGGLRYMYRTNNLNVETLETNIVACFTNRAVVQPVMSTGLTFFAQAVATNTPAQLLGLFPGLQILSTNTYFTSQVQQVVTGFLTNEPFQPALAAPVTVLVTNFVTNIFQTFEYQFGNVQTNLFSPTSQAQLRLSDFIRDPLQPATSTNLIQRTTTTSLLTNIPAGDIIIFPTNQCGFDLVVTQALALVFTNTNTIFQAVGTNALNLVTNQLDLLVFSTNYFYLTFPINQDANVPRLRRGVDRLRFARMDFDSLLGQTIVPATNTFDLFQVVNGTNLVQSARRVAQTPDIVFAAQDLGIAGVGPVAAFRTVANNWTNNAALNSQVPAAGPGVISPQRSQVEIIFNKVGPSFLNENPFFLDQTTAFPFFVWGSFDGSTNAPVVYPVGSTIEALENQVLNP